MGLDIIELGIRIEREFDIHIEDADYERLKTVADVERYVTWKLGRTGRSGWSSYQLALLRSFCQVRQAITRQTGIPRRELRPSTRLQEHWPTMTEWQAASAALSEGLEVPLPAWRVEGWMLGGCAGILLAPLMAVAFQAMGGSMLWVPATIVLGWAMGAALAFRSAQEQFRDARLATVVRGWCFERSLHQVREAGTTLSRHFDDDILVRVIAIVSEVGSIPPDEVRRESRFIEDLKFE